MHEASLMKTALDLALSQAAAQGARRVHRLGMRVGDLSGVVPDALQFAFEALSLGSAAEGARLDIERVAPRYACDTCGAEFDPAEELLPECPHCGALGGRLCRGLELELTSLEIS
ncbi:MAG: hydrogenase maturation nickel metallochaperone HypA [Verrucomicrobiae bacterium]|nr:hydrogenase maturation nickel metallochaperone HypA [Verrucomicrobiae bacterium]